MTNTLQPQPLPRLGDGFVELDCGTDRAYEFAPAEPGRVLIRQHAAHLEPLRIVAGRKFARPLAAWQ